MRRPPPRIPMPPMHGIPIRGIPIPPPPGCPPPLGEPVGDPYPPPSGAAPCADASLAHGDFVISASISSELQSPGGFLFQKPEVVAWIGRQAARPPPTSIITCLRLRISGPPASSMTVLQQSLRRDTLASSLQQLFTSSWPSATRPFRLRSTAALFSLSQNRTSHRTRARSRWSL